MTTMTTNKRLAIEELQQALQTLEKGFVWGDGRVETNSDFRLGAATVSVRRALQLLGAPAIKEPA